jgi:hypothetical protein
MRTFTVVVAGFALQAIGLVAFVAVSTAPSIANGKWLVVGASALAMGLLLLFANTPYRFSRSAVRSALLAFGFVIAHRILGRFFPGLSKDIEILSIQHLRTLGFMFALLFALYLAGSMGAGALGRLLQGDPQNRAPES